MKKTNVKLRTCSRCSKSGRFYDDPCGKCKHKLAQKEEHKSLMPRFNSVYKSRV